MQDWPEVKPVFLVGNHELMMLQFLQNPVDGRRWLRHGGYETLLSYEIADIGDLGDADQLRRIAEQLRDAMGPHLEFIENLEAWHRNGNLLVTHAGAQPSLPPGEQPIDALVWGVPEFFRTRRQDGLWVVHGHTVVEEPSMHQGRIAIDTGAYRTGRLTALRANGEEVGFFTQRGPEAEELAEAWDD
jgi:serine/threonine protein phosphatase 1